MSQQKNTLDLDQQMKREFGEDPGSKWDVSIWNRVVDTEKNCRYPVRYFPDKIDSIVSLLGDSIAADKALIVTTDTVNNLYADEIHRELCQSGFDVEILILDCSESAKNISQVYRICETSLECNMARNSILVSIGGGVVTDIVTMAASVIRRGVRCIRVPTTLIGQVDAAIGIKGAVNLNDKKSYIGCFYAPEGVLISPEFLKSLPAKHLRCGMAEIIKIGLVLDEHLFELIESHGVRLIDSSFQDIDAFRDEVLWKSIDGMLNQLEPNLFEDQTYERLVDFGHTFSPLLESITHYSLCHGEAVSIDMALSAAIANELGLISEEDRDRVVSVLVKLGLPVYSQYLTVELCKEAIAAASLHRAGHPNLVIPVSIGSGDFIRSEELLDDSIYKNAIDAVWLLSTLRNSSTMVSHA